MASFSDLSNELVLLILDRVFPEDLVSFCLVSKHVHRLSVQKLARHRIMAQQNHKVCSYSNATECYGRRADQLPTLLCRVLDDPFVGHYVKWIDFDLELSEPQLDGSIATRTGHGVYPDQQMTTFEAAIRSTNIPIHFQKILLEALAKNGRETIAALLLLHSPNLERLDFRVTKPPYLLSRNIRPASIVTVAHLASKSTFINPCLKRLKRVSLDFSWPLIPSALAKIFMSLPSVTSLTIGTTHTVDSSQEIQDLVQGCVTLPEASSNVADLHLTGYFTDSAELSEMLKGCKNLAHLSVEFEDYSQAQFRRICFPEVAAILRISAEHSLKSLKFRRHYRPVPTDVVDCSAFKNLCQINVEAQMLLKPHDEYNPKTVVDRLPHSLQRLYLEYGLEHGVPYERDSLRALENPKLVQLPNLRLLQVSLDIPHRARHVADSLSGSEERFGLDYVVTDRHAFKKIFHAADSDNDEDT